MQIIRLGRTNLKVSRVGIGGIPLQRPSEKEAIKIIKHALDSGINIIDTSVHYGESEVRIGKALFGRRDDVILITRTGVTDKQRTNEYLEKSLKQLQTDFIDIYQVHNISTTERYDAVMGEGGALEAIFKAKEKGKIGHIGFTSHNVDIMKKAIKSKVFDVILFPFNFINNEAAEKLVPLTKELDIGFTAMKPFAGGRLENANLAIKYLLQFDNIVPVPGVETKEEIDEIISIVSGSWDLTDEENMQIEKIRKDLDRPFCQWCGYCMPECPQEINIPGVINLKVNWDLWPQETFISRKKNLVDKARTCIECGNCEEKCPYNLPIREMLTKAIEFYDNIVIKSKN